MEGGGKYSQEKILKVEFYEKQTAKRRSSIENSVSTTMYDGSGAVSRNIIIWTRSEQNTGLTRSSGVTGRRRSSF